MRAAALELGRGGVLRRAAEDDDERSVTAKPGNPPAPAPRRFRPDRPPPDPVEQERRRQERQEQEAREEHAELEVIKAAYFKECEQHDHFGNVSDFYSDIHAFAGVEKPPAGRPAAIPAPMAAPLLKRRIKAVAKATTIRRLARIIAPQSVRRCRRRCSKGAFARGCDTRHDADGERRGQGRTAETVGLVARIESDRRPSATLARRAARHRRRRAVDVRE